MVTLQEYAGVESFQGRFRSVQPLLEDSLEEAELVNPGEVYQRACV